MKAKTKSGIEKIMPERYIEVFCDKIIENPQKKRLTTQERLNLECKIVIQSLSKYEIELIAGSKPKGIKIIETREKSYNVIVFDNGVEVVCPRNLRGFIESETIKRNY